MRTDYKDFIPSTALKEYRLINNANGTVSLEDVTVYEQEGDRLSAGTLNELSKNSVWPLTCTTTNTTHALTGLNGAEGLLTCAFTADADFAEGNVFTVDGNEYAVKMQDGSDAKAGLFVAGAKVQVLIDTEGQSVNFKAAGGKGGISLHVWKKYHIGEGLVVGEWMESVSIPYSQITMYETAEIVDGEIVLGGTTASVSTSDDVYFKPYTDYYYKVGSSAYTGIRAYWNSYSSAYTYYGHKVTISQEARVFDGFVADADATKYPSNGLAADGCYYQKVESKFACGTAYAASIATITGLAFKPMFVVIEGGNTPFAVQRKDFVDRYVMGSSGLVPWIQQSVLYEYYVTLTDDGFTARVGATGSTQTYYDWYAYGF